MPGSRVLLLELAVSAGLVAGACSADKAVDACGDALPMEGALCTREGQECLPDENGCGLYSGVRCSGGVWVFFEAGTGSCTTGTSGGGPLACGEELPPDGTICEGEGADCAPGKDLCAGYAGATCTNGRWERYEVEPGAPEDCQNSVDCGQVCPAMVAAGCTGGPADGEACVGECEARLAGSCNAEFSNAVTCGGEPLTFTCDAAKRPTIAGCEDEFAALYGCLG